jgi:hypothetical protein
METAVREQTNTLPTLPVTFTQLPVDQIDQIVLKPLNLVDKIIDAINKKQHYLSYHLMRNLSVEEFLNLPDIEVPQQSGDYAWKVKLTNLILQRNVFTSGIVQSMDQKQEDPVLFGFEDKPTYVLHPIKSYKPVDVIKNYFYAQERDRCNFGRPYSGGYQVKGSGRRICFDRDTLYSYGLDIAHRVMNGFIINGDISTPTTNGDINYSFHTAPLGSSIIPFSVLLGALIKDFNKLELIQGSADWYEETKDSKGETTYLHHLGETLFKHGSRYFLSTLEARRYRQHYYLLELNQPVTSIEQAKQSASGLNNEQWIRYQSGEIKRQGEFLFIPVNIKDYVEKTLFKVKDYIEKNNFRVINHTLGRFPIHETGKPMIELGDIFKQPNQNPHYPRDLIRLNGDVFVRGTVRHPEHGMLRLGAQWHLVQLNNVKHSFQPQGRVD